MKYKKLLLIPATVLMSLSNSSFTPIQTLEPFVFSKDVYGPFFYGQEDTTLNFQYTYYGSHVLEAIEEVTVYYKDSLSSTPVRQLKTSPHGLSNGKTYKFSFTFSPTSCIDERFGARFTFKIYNLNFDVCLFNQEREIFFSNLNYFSTPDIEENPVLSPLYYSFTLNNKTVPQEKFYFNETSLICNESSKAYIDISNIYFKYDFLDKLSSDSCIARILDINKYFTLFPRVNDFAYIPLSLKQVEDKYYMKFQGLYANAETLECSTIQYAGFRPCDKLYIPLSKIKQVKPFQFEISLYQLGISRITIHLAVSYYPTGNLIGDCSNSEYCLVGGVNYD